MAQGNVNEKIVFSLAQLLRQNGDRVLSGDARLSLTSQYVVFLNEGFTHIQDVDFQMSFEALPANGFSGPVMEQLHFLYDLVQKTPSLKLLHHQGTLSGCVNILAFRSLRFLELRWLPIHLVTGLQKLRDRLTTIICTRCLSSLQELFESCGGDQASAMAWPSLLSADLSYNNIEQLDDSLRLLPNLECLDLSHNAITKTENCLEYLSSLHMLDLGYNGLQLIPLFSLSTRTTLQILNIRHNDLDDLHGIEELIALRELDAAYNCISRPDQLESLKQCLNLQQIVLKGNPLGYHKQYRNIVCTILGIKLASKVKLDRQLFTKSDLQILQGIKLSSSPPVSSSTQRLIIEDTASSLDRSYDFHRDGPSTTYDYSSSTAISGPDGAGTPEMNRRGRRSRASRKARKVQISDMSASEVESFKGHLHPLQVENCDSNSRLVVDEDDNEPAPLPLTPPDGEHLTVKKELENIRHNLGSDWLQSLAIQHPQSSHPAAKRVSPTTDPSKPESVDLPDKTGVIIEVVPASSAPVSEEGSWQRGCNLSGDSTAPAKATFQIGSEPDVVIANELRNSSLSPKRDQLSPVPLSPAISVPSRERHSSEDDTFKWGDSDPEDEDCGNESEPMIVIPMDDTDQQLMVTVTERYLIERDLNGCILGRLDLQCLTDMKNIGRKLGAPVVYLEFDHVRRDKRQRHFLMEDDASAKILDQLLYPALEERRHAVALRDRYQCLRCGIEFQKGETALGSFNKNQVSRSLDVKTSDLPEEVVCPACHSKMVVSLHPDMVSRGPPPVTMAGSAGFPGNHLDTLPLATSSTNTSPSKASRCTERSSASPKAKPSSNFSSPSQNLMSDPQSLGCYPLQPDTVSGQGEESTSTSEGARHTDKLSTMDNLVKSQSDSSASAKHQHRKKTNNKYANKGKHDEMYIASDGDIEVLPNPSADIISAQVNATDSDIVTLPYASEDDVFLKKRSTDSDISILSKTSEDVARTKSSMTPGLRVRQVSTGSDIVVLGSTEADLLSSTTGKEQLTIGEVEEDESLSPCGSLTHNTVHSMVSSIYDTQSIDNTDGEDKTCDTEHVGDGINYTKDSQDTKDSLQNRGPVEQKSPVTEDTAISTESEPTHRLRDPRQPRLDFSHIDHRLKLWLTMNIFRGDTEEFILMIKVPTIVLCGSRPLQFPGMLVVSSSTIYILKFKPKQDQSLDTPDKWLKCQLQQSLSSLKVVEAGLGHQTLWLTFSSPLSVNLVVRDELHVKSFKSQLADAVSLVPVKMSPDLTFMADNALAASRVQQQIILASSDAEDDVDKDIMCFILGHIQDDHMDTPSAVCIAVTSSHIYLATENYTVCQPRASDVTNPNSPAQYQLKEHRNITDITSADLDEKNAVRINFLDEETGDEFMWNMHLETEHSRQSLLETICQTWRQEFGVELDVNGV